MPDAILRNLGAIGAKQVAELCSIILLTPTKWSVWTLLAGGVFISVGTEV
jgi:hypothetical protein